MLTYKISRRDFIKTSLGAGTAFAISFTLPGCNLQPADPGTRIANDVFKPNAWIRIAMDNSITVVVPESEMGQGVLTSLPMLVAEELDADWQLVGYEQAPLDPAFGIQSTGGSTSIRHAWKNARQASAAARKMLVTAAAQQWKVSESECRTQNSTVIHIQSGKQLKYGELVHAAAALPLPESVTLKQPGEFRIIGKPVARLDAAIKVKGEALFGLDVVLPGMLIATIAHCPVFGGKLARYDDAITKNLPGVKHVLVIDSGAVVIATHYWAAKQGLDALDIEWALGDNGKINNHSISAQLENSLNGPAEIIDERGDSSAMKNSGRRHIEASYEVPFQAHATMEPMNCTADVRENKCEIWAPTQSPSEAQKTAAELLPGLAMENILVHTTFLGGGFGRRLNQDFVAEAVQISRAVKTPVKLIWPRSEDMQHDHYRPVTRHRLIAAIDPARASVAWHHRIAGSVKQRSAGGAEAVAYAFDYRLIDFVDTPTHVPTGAWRSVGHSQNAFVIESFIDELAYAMQQDPYRFRLGLLKDKPRHKAVLQLAAEKAGWGNPLPDGRFRGIALHASFDSYVAQVADVSINKDQSVRVHRVVCAIDCGIVINPDTVAAQMESGIVFGLTATLKGKIDINAGAVAQSNFHDFPLLTIGEMPDVETYIVPSTGSPGGVGEPGVPPIAPAVANAVFAATGKRVRTLPINWTV
ncbi:MAG: xanthine dehydrogenase family protein molybdopterin-binding subunit [Gammaproteobacteria bacterium]|nr:xanthine dehydrogenase family protein molybdopterin-binding subunit [Gammaproteobacteria bacterium]